MRRVADADQARPPPLPQAIARHLKECNTVEAFDLADAVREERRQFQDALAERLDAGRLHLLDAALWNDIGALPVIAAVEHHQERTGLDMAEGFGVVAPFARDAKP